MSANKVTYQLYSFNNDDDDDDESQSESESSDISVQQLSDGDNNMEVYRGGNLNGDGVVVEDGGGDTLREDRIVMRFLPGTNESFPDSNSNGSGDSDARRMGVPNDFVRESSSPPPLPSGQVRTKCRELESILRCKIQSTSTNDECDGSWC